MGYWIDRHLGEGLARKETILSALDLLIGTAISTSFAVQFANLYFGWHEQETILPKYRDLLGRLFLLRLVETPV
eukprot:scaffold154769_cov36-Cyclotella_meneghiniana.AAC.2